MSELKQGAGGGLSFERTSENDESDYDRDSSADASGRSVR